MYTSDDDARAALMQGEEAAVSYFFQAYYTALTYFAKRLVKGETTAEDIAATAFAKLWDKRNLIRGSVKSWLYASVKNACIDHLRKARRETLSLQDYYREQEAFEKTALEKQIETETYTQLYAAIQKIPLKSRQVFLMFYIEGKSYQEIADELGLSIHTVCNQKARALRHFREQLPPGLTLAAALCMLSTVQQLQH